MAARKNVTVHRPLVGNYILRGKSGCIIAELTADQWRDLGLRQITIGSTRTVDLQVSGLPKKRKQGK